MAAKKVQQKEEQIPLPCEDVEETLSVRQSKLKPSRVVTFTKEEATFDNSEIKRVLEDNKANDDQVVVISISGVWRSGKSFLINMMANYLDYYCQNGSDDGWEECEIPITGIKWAKGQNNSVTHGIWMIVYPNLVNKKRIVFLDCQGTGDHQQSTSNLDNMIMFYALKLSNVTIVNTRGNLNTTDLQSMGMCVLSAKKKRKVADGFQDLVFLIRDWDDEEEPTTLDTLVKTTLSREVKTPGQAVLEACRSVESVSLPHPGKKITRASETDSVLVKVVDEDFLLACKKLFKQIMIVKPAGAPAENVSGFDFRYKFQVLGLETVGKVQSQMEAYLSSRVGEAYEEAQNFLEKKMNEIQGNNMMGRMKSQLKGYLRAFIGVMFEDTYGSHEVDSDVKTFKSKVEKMKEAAKEALETAKKQYLADERVAEHASDERKSEDINRLQLIVDSAIKKAEYQLETLKRKEQMRVEEERASEERLRLAKMQEELTSKQEELTSKQKELTSKQEELTSKQEELVDWEEQLKDCADGENQLEEFKTEQNKIIASLKRLEEELAERESKEKENEAAWAAEVKRLQKKLTERDRIAQEKFDKKTEKSGWCSIL